MVKLNGHLIWEGKSQLDYKTEIILIATYNSSNTKTGEMAQTWILNKHVSPTQAVVSEVDSSICGNCIHRPTNAGSCYVTTFQAPSQVWNSYRKGNYPKITLQELYELDRTPIRFGSYGDPTAVPFEIWKLLSRYSLFHTGYTHQWKNCDQRFKSLLMASVDNPEERELAKQLGWTTFRVRRPDEPLQKNEMICLASEEASKKQQCITCGMCDPNRNQDVAIIVHGSPAKVQAYARLPTLEEALSDTLEVTST